MTAGVRSGSGLIGLSSGLHELCTVRFKPRRWIIMADYKCLVVIIEKFEAKIEANN
jgi:hypothetical protein